MAIRLTPYYCGARRTHEQARNRFAWCKADARARASEEQVKRWIGCWAKRQSNRIFQIAWLNTSKQNTAALAQAVNVPWQSGVVSSSRAFESWYQQFCKIRYTRCDKTSGGISYLFSWKVKCTDEFLNNTIQKMVNDGYQIIFLQVQLVTYLATKLS